MQLIKWYIWINISQFYRIGFIGIEFGNEVAGLVGGYIGLRFKFKNKVKKLVR